MIAKDLSGIEYEVRNVSDDTLFENKNNNGVLIVGGNVFIITDHSNDESCGNLLETAYRDFDLYSVKLG